MKKYISLLLCVCVLFSFSPVHTHAQSTNKSISVTMLNGYGKYSSTVDVMWNDIWLSAPSSMYNHDLATTLMAFSGAVYSAYDIEAALNRSDFSSIELHYPSYSKENPDMVSYAFASKAFSDFNAVIIVVRGTSSGTEWYSNFDIGTDGHHKGFSNAMSTVYSDLKAYLALNHFSFGNTKFIITGHSRGAAVSNLLSANILTDYPSVKENLYSYTFATPQTTKAQDAKAPLYSGIFNIVNPEDFITAVPVSGWGYCRYGTDLYLPSSNMYDQAVFSDIYTSMTQSFQAMTQTQFEGFDTGSEKVDLLIQKVFSLAPTLDDYYNLKYNLIYPNPWIEDDTKLSLSEYFSHLAAVLAESNTSSLAVLGKSLAGDFSGISTFFITQSGAGIGEWKFNAGIWCAHCPASYFSWMSTLNPDELFGALNWASSTTFSALSYYAPFDVSSKDEYYNSIIYVTQKGIMNGTGENLFSPSAPLTRGMLVTILYRLENTSYYNPASSFTDVSADMWYSRAVNWAVDNNITTGYPDSTFRPDTPLTREQLAVFLYRYANLKGYDTSFSASVFTLDEISPYAREAYLWALENSILKPHLPARESATRGEVAYAITNLLS